ncbi:hypothetical protein CTI14_52580 [Methylobacterium radiotolerans]|nr:hypothetical protein CTI14_52580 [Methylobacterium radiotolerans]
MRLEDLEDYWADIVRLSKRAERTYRGVERERPPRALDHPVRPHRRGRPVVLEAVHAFQSVAIQVGRIIVRES